MASVQTISKHQYMKNFDNLAIFRNVNGYRIEAWKIPYQREYRCRVLDCECNEVIHRYYGYQFPDICNENEAIARCEAWVYGIMDFIGNA